MLELTEQIPQIMPTAIYGSVARIIGTTVAASGFPAPVGAVAAIARASGPPLECEVIGFRDDTTLLYPWGETTGIRRGDSVRLVRTTAWLRTGPALLGRVLDAHGNFIDGGRDTIRPHRVPMSRKPPPAVERPRIDTPLSTGVRVMDGLLTCGRGQRMGIFAGSGVGKSVTLGMMARYTSADVNVIALIGERGREVNDFIERDLRHDGLQKSVVVVATSDEPAVVRVRAALAATAVAEYFRDMGKDVLLMMDSVTRFAQAQREIGLAAGEPPTTRGFPPSVFAMLPKLVERAGRSQLGSITAFYSVLVEADDPNEPICDAVRGLLDGHTWLSRKIASRGHYPAVDVLDSLSRLMNDIVPTEHVQAATVFRELLAAYRDHEDLISIGAYRKGANPIVDTAIEMMPELNRYLRQQVEEPSDTKQAKEGLMQLMQVAAARRASAAAPANARR